MESTMDGQLKIWRLVQALVWLIGFGIFFCLVFYPQTGVMLFWNILIPVAPFLLVVGTGLWRNICPLATVVLLPRHLNLSARKKMPPKAQALAGFTAILLLYLIVPLRHAVFNMSGQATAILLALCCVAGITLGFFYEWKSAWCSGFCPVHPVEKMYGGNVAFRLKNAHCDHCMHCVSPCPDSTANMNTVKQRKGTLNYISGVLITGGLPGFVWGWFHVPDIHHLSSFTQFAQVYSWPLTGLLATVTLYLILTEALHLPENQVLRWFAASAVSCYYWYRIPGLLGYGLFDRDGMLVNLSASVSHPFVQGIAAAMGLFFFYWLVFRKPNKKSWVLRPV